MTAPDTEFLRRRIEALSMDNASLLPDTQTLVAPAGQPPDMPKMNERLAKLEGAFDSFKTVLTIFGGVLALSVTITLAGIVFLSNRIDRLETSISGLPDKVNANLRDLTGVLSQAITASKQQSPQILLLPPPQPTPALPQQPP